MEWLKKILGLDNQEQKLNEISSLAAKLLEKENNSNAELHNNFKQLNKKIEETVSDNDEFRQDLIEANQKLLESQKAESKNSLDFKTEMNKNLSAIQKGVETAFQAQQKQLETVKTEVAKIVEEVLPQPFNPNYQLVDPLDINKTLFSFEVTDISIINKKKIDVDTNSFLQTLGGNMPNLIGNGLLVNSYRFVFPSGVSGKVMQLANGQGTAVMQGGKIVQHGAYASSLMIAAPLVVFNIGTMVIQQHYLAKINANLDQINVKVTQLLELEFIKKHAKIESIIYFLERAHNDFAIIENNKDYRNAILSNLVRTNIEIFELIQFYKKSFKFIDKTKTSENELNFKYFLALHTLFKQGKLIELKYASEYNEILISNLKDAFEELNRQSIDSLVQNKAELNREIKVTDENRAWYDWIFGVKADSINKIKSLSDTNNIVDTIISHQKDESQKVVSELEEFRAKLVCKQEFLIQDGELFEVIEKPKMRVRV
jgi:hypothetical protein